MDRFFAPRPLQSETHGGGDGGQLEARARVVGAKTEDEESEIDAEETSK